MTAEQIQRLQDQGKPIIDIEVNFEKKTYRLDPGYRVNNAHWDDAGNLVLNDIELMEVSLVPND